MSMMQHGTNSDSSLTTGIKLIIILSIVQAALRLAFFSAQAGLLGEAIQADVNGLITVEISQMTRDAIMVMFGIIGAMGLVFAIRLYQMKACGIYGTIGISAVTIIFDAWAVMTIQSSAIIGMVLPAVFIVYLLAFEMKRRNGAVV